MRTTIKKDQIYQHFKGNVYKVYGTAKEIETKNIFVLYYSLSLDYLFRLSFTPDIIVHTETLEKFSLCYPDYSAINNLFLQTSNRKSTLTEKEIDYFKNNLFRILWARPKNNFETKGKFIKLKE